MSALRRAFLLWAAWPAFGAILSAEVADVSTPTAVSTDTHREDEGDSRDAVLRGPLRISARETVSKERGKVIEASGDVFVKYDLESGDRIESTSQFARYDEKDMSGELTGDPKAVWKQRDPRQPSTTLTADKIFLKIKAEELRALGNVVVHQASSTLTAEEIAYSNQKKLMTAQGGTPEFDVRQPGHHTRIRADKVTARTERRQINFEGDVHGVVRLEQGSSGDLKR